jgi:hypothetical protein
LRSPGFWNFASAFSTAAAMRSSSVCSSPSSVDGLGRRGDGELHLGFLVVVVELVDRVVLVDVGLDLGRVLLVLLLQRREHGFLEHVEGDSLLLGHGVLGARARARAGCVAGWVPMTIRSDARAPIDPEGNA